MSVCELEKQRTRAVAKIDGLFVENPGWRAQLTGGADRDLEEDIMKASFRLTAEEPIEPNEDTGNSNVA